MLSIKTARRNTKPGIGKNGARRARNIIVSIVLLLVLLVGSGVGYTWYMGKYAKVESSAIAPPLNTLPEPVVEVRKQAPDAVVGASVQMITSPLVPGMNAMITVKTNTEAKCVIKVVYDKTASTDSGLSEKTADEYGMVSWTWTVEPTAPLGLWPVTVTCANAKNSAVVKADLKLDKTLPDTTAGN